MLLEAAKISLFTKHPGTIGAYRESILREYLKKFTPRNLSITSGFVSDYRSAEEDKLFSVESRQIDCITFDKNNFVPFLETGDFSIIAPESIYAAIEIKSNLTFYKEKKPGGSKETDLSYPLGGYYQEAYRWSGTLVDAFTNILSVTEASKAIVDPIFTGILAYSASFDTGNLYHAFDNNEIQKQLGIKHLSQLPFIICVPSNFVVVFSPDSIFYPSGSPFFHESHFNSAHVIEGNEAFPLQFFTTYYNNQIKYRLNQDMPHKTGLFTGGAGPVKIFSHHFDLDCSGLCD